MQQINFREQVCVNARAIASNLDGQERVAAEIIKRLPGMQQIMPDRPLAGIKGHAWEQAVLPILARNRLIWSPSATGPVTFRRQVVTIHDTVLFDHPEYFAPSFVRFHTNLIRLLTRRAAAVVTVSEFSRRSLAVAAGMPRDHIQVIYNGVSDHFRLHRPAEIAVTRAAMNLPERYVLCQATSDKRKNLAGTVKAWRAARPHLPKDLMLVVAGNLAGADGFGAASAEIGDPDIRITGDIPEEHTGPLMAGAEVFLFPSLYESSGLPIVESMASGVPIITGNTTALPEVAGRAARLVDASDARDLSNALIALVSDANAKAILRATGLRRAAHFSWDQAARDYEWTFQRVLMAQAVKLRAAATSAREQHAPWP
jgi:glycosyltransferase involved in cell wall biosynthesis